MRALSQQTPLLIRSKVLSEASVVSSAARYTPEFRSVNVGHFVSVARATVFLACCERASC